MKVRKLIDRFQDDQSFLAAGLKEADSSFQKKFNSPNTSQQLLKSLCWERVEYNTLLQQAQAFRAVTEDLLPHLQPGNARVQDVSVCLRDIKPDLLKYLRNLFMKKRQPAATHVLAILLSEECRNKKPYSIPVQFIPYHSIKDQYIRDISATIKSEMVKMDLKPVGRYRYLNFSFDSKTLIFTEVFLSTLFCSNRPSHFFPVYVIHPTPKKAHGNLQGGGTSQKPKVIRGRLRWDSACVVRIFSKTTNLFCYQV